MSEILQSINEWFKEKTSSPLYFVFILTFIGWNWRSFYVLFFESESLLETSKIEYIEKFSRVYYQIPYLGSWSDLLVHPFNWLLVFIFVFSVPIIFTYLLIWKFPYLLNLAHKQSLLFEFDRKKEFHKQNTEYQVFVSKKKIEEAEAVEKKVEAQEKINEILSDEDKWILEYEEIKSPALITALQNAEHVVYSYSGYFTRKFDQNNNFRKLFNPEQLSILDLYDLVIVLENDILEFTPKGKFFLKKLKQEVVEQEKQFRNSSK